MRSFILTMAALAAGALLSRSAAGQDTLVRPAAWSALSERPRFRDTTSPAAGIRYPDILRSAGVAGEVRAEVVVGADGRPEPSSLHIVSSTHDLFTGAVRRAISNWSLSPPLAGGQAVRAAVPVIVSFELSANRGDPSRAVADVTIDAAGIRVSLGWRPIARVAGLVAGRADARAATIGVLSALIPIARAMKGGAVCVSWSDLARNAPPDVLEQLRATDVGVLNADRCPRTYGSMILRVDSLGKPIRSPNGAPDPTWISTRDVQPWTENLYVLNGFVSQSTMTSHYRCTARREGPGATWTATCELAATSVS